VPAAPFLTDFELSGGGVAGAATATKFGGGTADYLAPEGEPSPAADMYAFGVCAVKACLPAGGCTLGPGRLALPDECDEQLRAIATALLSREPAARPTANETLAHPFLSPAAATAAAMRREAEVRKTPSWPRLGQLQPFIAVFLQECMGQLASFGPA
jgi:serine/threonine protein kinase